MKTETPKPAPLTVIGKAGVLGIVLGVYLDHTDPPSWIRGPAFIVAGAVLFALDWLLNGSDSRVANNRAAHCNHRCNSPTKS